MPRKFLRGLCILTLVGMALGISHPLSARAATQSVGAATQFVGAATQVLDPRVEYVFGQQITFHATLQPDVGVTVCRFYFRRLEDSTDNMAPATLDDQGVLTYKYDLIRFPLRVFSRLEFWFEVTVEGGEIVTSSQGVFYYEDNRFVWQPPLQSGPFRVHWYEGDQAFGEQLLEVAQNGYRQAQNWMPLYAPDEVNIYVYATAQEMRSTSLLAGTNWVAGHADPDLGLIVISIPPGPEQRTEMERQIPHELMHILLYQETGSDYNTKLPAWLKEGLASINEISPNPYYHTILSQAAAKGSLFSFSDICQNFPVDASGAYLAYAQSESFTRYLHDQYGAEGMETLVAIYKESSKLDCQDGITQSLGVSLQQLESSWQQTVLEGKSTTTKGSSPWPWVTVLGVVLAVPLIVLVANGFRRARRPQSTAKSGRST